MSTTDSTLTTTAERHAYALTTATAACGDLDTWQLAQLAQCAVPTACTEGAEALDTARAVALEAIEWELSNVDADEAALICSGDGADLLVDLVSDSIHEGIDSTAVLIYTARTRDAFHQLDGWSESLEDLGTPDDLDTAATWILFEILRRAAHAVTDEFAEAYTGAVAEFPGLDDDEDDDEDGDE